MTDTEKLDLILDKLRGIEDALGITRRKQEQEYQDWKRRCELERMPPEQREAILKAQQYFGQSYRL